MNIRLDDVRFPPNISDREQAKNYDEFVQLVDRWLTGLEPVGKVSFDNDLGEDKLGPLAAPMVTLEDGGRYREGTVLAKMGLDCMGYMLDMFTKAKLPYPVIYIHSANYPMRQRMENLCKDYGIQPILISPLNYKDDQRYGTQRTDQKKHTESL